MAQLTAKALLIMQRQLGHISAGQLTHAGVTADVRRTLVNSGVLTRPNKWVYRVAGLRPTLEHRLIATCLAHPSGFVTGSGVAKQVGLRRIGRTVSIQLCVPHGSRTDVEAGITLRQSTKISPLDTRRLDNGMIVASWPRLLFDLAAELPPSSLRSVIDQVLRDGGCDPEELGAIARRLCHPRRPGSTQFLDALDARGVRGPVDSNPELLVLEGLLARGVPVEPQFQQLRLPNGREVRVDMAVPAVRWGVEVDVHPGHLTLVGSTGDKQRDRQLHLLDWQVERVTDIDLIDLPGILDELAELYHARRRARAS